MTEVDSQVLSRKLAKDTTNELMTCFLLGSVDRKNFQKQSIMNVVVIEK